MPRSKPNAAALSLELFDGFLEAPTAPQAPAASLASEPPAPAPVELEATPSRDEGASLAVRELRGFPIRYYLELPTGSALRFALEDGGEAFVVATDKAAHGRALEEGVPVFAGGELRALAIAAKNDRLWGDELRAELERKRRNPRHRTRPQDVLGAVLLSKCEPLDGYTFRELEARLRVELVDVAIG